MSIRPKILLASAVTLLAAGIAAWQYLTPGSYSPVTLPRQSYPVRGVDISAHNGDIDFDALAADSIDFVIIKATEGTSFKDSRFQHNHLAATRAGLKVGAYHFFRFDTPGYTQALNLLHSVRGRHLDLPLVVDIEEWTNPTDRTTPMIVRQLRQFIDILERNGHTVMLYSNKDGHARFIRDNFGNYPLWLCSFTGEPEGQWRLWQYTHRGTLAGTQSALDINVFNGTRDEWQSWITTPTIKGNQE